MLKKIFFDLTNWAKERYMVLKIKLIVIRHYMPSISQFLTFLGVTILVILAVIILLIIIYAILKYYGYSWKTPHFFRRR